MEQIRSHELPEFQMTQSITFNVAIREGVMERQADHKGAWIGFWGAILAALIIVVPQLASSKRDAETARLYTPAAGITLVSSICTLR